MPCCLSILSSPPPVLTPAPNLNALNPAGNDEVTEETMLDGAVDNGAGGIGGTVSSPLSFLRFMMEPAALKAREALGDAGSGVELRGG